MQTERRQIIQRASVWSFSEVLRAKNIISVDLAIHVFHKTLFQSSFMEIHCFGAFGALKGRRKTKTLVKDDTKHMYIRQKQSSYIMCDVLCFRFNY